jgi:hypothetical protein
MAMDPDTKAYLDVNFLHLTEKIADIKSSLAEKIASSDKGIEHLKKDVAEIYGLDRARAEECDAHRENIWGRINKLDSRILNLEAWRTDHMKQQADRDGNKKWRIEVILPTVISILVLAVTVWLAFKFGG